MSIAHFAGSFGGEVLPFHQKMVLVPLASFDGINVSSTKGRMCILSSAS
jgi:hypothetical protein